MTLNNDTMWATVFIARSVHFLRNRIADVARMQDTVILASKSPRRQALLADLGLAFTVDVAAVDEAPYPDEPPGELAIRLSRAKASAVAARHPGESVLAADTVVAFGTTLLGKPADPREATAMLAALRGCDHQVYTAVSLARGERLATRLSLSHVTMRDYSDAEIAAYVASGDPLDKAGAYAIQHPLFSPVARWDGCYAGIMGLPLGITAGLLVDAGVNVPADVVAACERLGTRCCLRDEAGS